MILYKRVPVRLLASERRGGMVWWGGGELALDTFAVTDVVCNGCNENIEDFGYVVYLSRSDFKYGRAYDVYCWSCLKRYFPCAQEAPHSSGRRKNGRGGVS